MSHSTVLVIGEDIEALLAPYDENISVDPYWEVKYENPGQCSRVAGWVEKGEIEANPSMEALFAKLTDGKAEQGVGEDQYGDVIRLEGGVIESRSVYNPDSRWDWYQVGGRWRGQLLLKAGRSVPHDAVLTPVHWSESLGGATPEVLPANVCDQARKGDLDIEGMRAEAATRAVSTWAQFKAIEDEHGPLPRWDTLLEHHGTDQIEVARRIYQTHPGIIAMREAHLVGFLNGWEEEYAPYDQDSFAERARQAAVPGFALLDKEHGWLEPGRMGWFGQTYGQSKDSYWDYLKEANAIIDAASDDDLFTVVDVHI